MKKVIAVYDPDTKFTESLVRGLMREEAFAWQTVLFTDREQLKAGLQEMPEAAVLIDAESGQALKEELRLRRKVYFAEERGASRTDRIPQVYKYQSVRQFARALQAALNGENGPEETETAVKQHVIAVASPAGRSGKTSFALTLGQLLAQQEKLLYVSLEFCPAYEAFFDGEPGSDLSDLLYAAETGRKLQKLSESIAEFHGMDVIGPVSTPEDLIRAEAETVRKVIFEAAELKESEAILLDLGPDLRLMSAFLAYAGEIYVTEGPDRVSEEKVKEFLKWIRRAFGEAVRKRVILIRPPKPPRFMSDTNYAESLLWSELGDYTRKLLGGAY